MDEEMIKKLIEHPEWMDASPEIIERCSQVVSKTAAMVVDIVSEEDRHLASRAE